MNRYNIDTCALLVEFASSVWTARKLDKTATDEVVYNKRAASKDAARVNKHLLAGRNELWGVFNNDFFKPAHGKVLRIHA